LACLHNPWDKLSLNILCDYLEDKGVLPDPDERTLYGILSGAWPENADEITDTPGTFGWFFSMLRVVRKVRYDVATCKSMTASREPPAVGTKADPTPDPTPDQTPDPTLPAARVAMYPDSTFHAS
jgi:hypothetical protein